MSSIDEEIESLKQKIMEALDKNGILNELQARFLADVSEFIAHSDFETLKPNKALRQEVAHQISQKVCAQFLLRRGMKHTLASANSEFGGEFMKEEPGDAVADELKVGRDTIWLHEVVESWKREKEGVLRRNKDAFRDELQSRFDAMDPATIERNQKRASMFQKIMERKKRPLTPTRTMNEDEKETLTPTPTKVNRRKMSPSMKHAMEMKEKQAKTTASEEDEKKTSSSGKESDEDNKGKKVVLLRHTEESPKNKGGVTPHSEEEEEPLKGKRTPQSGKKKVNVKRDKEDDRATPQTGKRHAITEGETPKGKHRTTPQSGKKKAAAERAPEEEDGEFVPESILKTPQSGKKTSALSEQRKTPQSSSKREAESEKRTPHRGEDLSSDEEKVSRIRESGKKKTPLSGKSEKQKPSEELLDSLDEPPTRKARSAKEETPQKAKATPQSDKKKAEQLDEVSGKRETVGDTQAPASASKKQESTPKASPKSRSPANTPKNVYDFNDEEFFTDEEPVPLKDKAAQKVEDRLIRTPKREDSSEPASEESTPPKSNTAQSQMEFQSSSSPTPPRRGVSDKTTEPETVKSPAKSPKPSSPSTQTKESEPPAPLNKEYEVKPASASSSGPNMSRFVTDDELSKRSTESSAPNKPANDEGLLTDGSEPNSPQGKEQPKPRKQKKVAVGDYYDYYDEEEEEEKKPSKLPKAKTAHQSDLYEYEYVEEEDFSEPPTKKKPTPGKDSRRSEKDQSERSGKTPSKKTPTKGGQESSKRTPDPKRPTPSKSVPKRVDTEDDDIVDFSGDAPKIKAKAPESDSLLGMLDDLELSPKGKKPSKAAKADLSSSFDFDSFSDVEPQAPKPRKNISDGSVEDMSASDRGRGHSEDKDFGESFDDIFDDDLMNEKVKPRPVKKSVKLTNEDSLNFDDPDLSSGEPSPKRKPQKGKK